jgi:large subunit ribosomal protein L6
MEIKTQLPEGFSAEYEEGHLTVEAEGEEVSRKFEHAMIDVEVADGEVVFSTDRTKKSIKSIVKTFQSHVQNMVDGIQDEHVYKMKGVYAHFPMTVKEENGKVIIENFMGERKPREIEIMDGVSVSIDGEDLTLRGADKEAVGQTAGRIEQACSKGNRDPRTFQDGVYITQKGGEE